MQSKVSLPLLPVSRPEAKAKEERPRKTTRVMGRRAQSSLQVRLPVLAIEEKTWGCGGDGEGIDRLQHFLQKHWQPRSERPGQYPQRPCLGWAAGLWLASFTLAAFICSRGTHTQRVAAHPAKARQARQDDRAGYPYRQGKGNKRQGAVSVPYRRYLAGRRGERGEGRGEMTMTSLKPWLASRRRATGS